MLGEHAQWSCQMSMGDCNTQRACSMENTDTSPRSITLTVLRCQCDDAAPFIFDNWMKMYTNPILNVNMD